MRRVKIMLLCGALTLIACTAAQKKAVLNTTAQALKAGSIPVSAANPLAGLLMNAGAWILMGVASMIDEKEASNAVAG